MRNILIFAKSQDSGFKKLKELIGELKFKDVLKFSKSDFGSYAELKDGTLYKVINNSDYARGYRGRKAYIEKGMPDETLERAYCCLAASDLPHEDQVEYFES